jgi:hypothetical protein
VKAIYSKTVAHGQTKGNVHFTQEPETSQPFLVRGVRTDGVTDGKAFPLDGAFCVTGTDTYITAAGGSKTVFVLEPAQ